MYYISRKKSKLKPFTKEAKRFVPSKKVMDVFDYVCKRLNIGDDNIDEIRKIYFFWFKKYQESISHGNQIIVNIPWIGDIIPHYNPYYEQMKNIVHNDILLKKSPSVVKKRLLKLYTLAIETDDRFIKFNNKNSKNERIEFNRVPGNVKRNHVSWSRNLAKRGIYTKFIGDPESKFDPPGFLF